MSNVKSLQSVRISSIDIFRATTMFLMIFVNDVAGVHNIPQWIKHTDADFDGMGFSDIIFPAFLFIVGLSLPFAINHKFNSGKKRWAITFDIFMRSLALITMGFFQVNLENYNHQLAFIPYSIYTILITLTFFLIWMKYPQAMRSFTRHLLIAAGILSLIILAILFRGGNTENSIGLKPHWWGILGLIGWAYLVAALVYVLIKGKPILLFGAFITFALINILTHLGMLTISLPIIGDASSITLILGGALAAVMYSTAIQNFNLRKFWLSISLYGVISIIFGLLIRPYSGGISKIYATPGWLFICMGITVLAFELIIWLIDVRKKEGWFKLIKPAGTSTLMCYLIPYLLYSIMALLHFNFPTFLNEGLGGICRSVAMAMLTIAIASVLEQNKIRLKL